MTEVAELKQTLRSLSAELQAAEPIPAMEQKLRDLRLQLSQTQDKSGLVKKEEDRIAAAVAGYSQESHQKKEAADALKKEKAALAAALVEADVRAEEALMAQAETEAANAKRLSEIQAGLHEQIFEIQESNLEQQRVFTAALEEILEGLEGESSEDAYEKLLAEVDAAKVKMIELESENASELQKIFEEHVEAVSEVTAKLLAAKKSMSTHESELASLNKELAALYAQEAAAAELRHKRASATEQQDTLLAGLKKEIAVLKNSLTVSDAKMAVSIMPTQKALLAAVSKAKLAAVAQAYRRMRAVKEAGARVEGAAEQEAAAYSDLKAEQAKILRTRENEAKKLHSTIEPVRKLKQTLAKVTAEHASTQAELQAASAEAKELAVKLLMADPATDTAIPVTPKPAAKKRGAASRNDSAAKKQKQ
ncbi:hypothetical protein DIPPA_05058 [Diplonema papillatum]|nr:hypothetical protein DIPPA_05058 [Diplonema papillatum]